MNEQPEAAPEHSSAGAPSEPGPFVDRISHAIESFLSLHDPVLLSAKIAQSLQAAFAAELVEVWTSGVDGEAPQRDAAASRSGEVPAAHGAVAEASAGIQHSLEVRPESFSGEFGQWAAAHGVCYAVVEPMLCDNRTIGTLAIYTVAPLPAHAAALARTCAAVVALRLNDARLLSDNRKAISQLQFLVEASQVLNSTLDLAQLLDLILNIACKQTGSQRGSVFLVDRERRDIWTILAHGLEEQEIRLKFGQGVAGHVAQAGTTLKVTDAYGCPYFDSSFDERFGYRTHNLFCTPIRNRTGDIVGILQLLNKMNGQFTREDEDFVSAMSIHMALALENARLHRELIEKQRLERELQLARTIQRSLLPDAPPALPGYDIAVLNEPCYEVGGDYYDFLSLGPNTLLLVIADVEGKGVGSAMVMSNLQATLRALVMHLHSLEVIALSLNEMIRADTRSEKFLSAFLGLIDTRRRGLHFINAGHVPPLLVRADGSYARLTDGGTVIGLFNSVEYARGSVRLNAGDVLVCCTDGITEGCDAREEEFGEERLLEVVRANRELTAQEIVTAVSKEVDVFTKNGGRIDDKVLMVVKVRDA